MSHMGLRRLGLCCALALLVSGCHLRMAQPDSEALREKNASADALEISNELALPQRPLTLDDLIELATQRNLELRVRELRAAIQHEVAFGEQLNMLPSLRASWNYAERNKHTGSFSQSLTPVPPSPPSISRERQTHTADVRLAYNLLDFGVTFYRARQEAYREQLERMEYERERQGLILKVVEKYWAAIAAKTGATQSARLLEQAAKQQETLGRLMDRQVVSQFVGLRTEGGLVDIQLRMREYERTYLAAMLELTQLVGLSPNSKWELAPVELASKVSADLADIDTLTGMALRNRPELFYNDLNEQIQMDEVRKATLQMLPGVELFGSYDFDHDRFLIFNNWFSLGFNVMWDLLKLPSNWQGRKSAQTQVEVARTMRLSQAVGVLVQVRLAVLGFEEAVRTQALLGQADRAKSRLLVAYQSGQDKGVFDDGDMIQAEADAIAAQVAAVQSYGEAQLALERINNAIGMPRYYRSAE